MAEQSMHKKRLADRYKAAVGNVGQTLGLIPTTAGFVAPAPSLEPKQMSKGSIVGLPRTDIISYSRGNYSVINTLSTLYSKITKSRKDYVEQHQSVSGFYLVEALFGAVAEDALIPEVTTGEILQLSSKNKTIAKALDELQENVPIDQMVNDLIDELLCFGEYGLRLEIESGKGVVAVHDDVDQSTLVGMYSKGYPEMYLWTNPLSGMLEILPPWGVAHFVLGKRRLRVDVQEQIIQALQNMNGSSDVWDQLPKHTRVGRPLLYGTIGKIAELQILEALIPAQKISRLTAGSIVPIQVPNTQNVEDTFNLCQKYEDVLNRKLAVDRDTDKLTVPQIMAQAGEIKVIPVIDGKGSLDRTDIRGTQEAEDLLRAVDDSRNAICSSIGFPTEVLFGGDTTGRTEVLKRYARYVRNLKMVQSSIVQGVLQIAMAHLSNKDIDYKKEDIDISFNNTLVDVDQLEALEHTDAALGVVSSVNDFLSNLAANSPEAVNPEHYRKWLSGVVNMLVNDAQLITPLKVHLLNLQLILMQYHHKEVRKIMKMEKKKECL